MPTIKNPENYSKRLEKFAKGLIKLQGQIIIETAQDVLATLDERIFDDGKAVDGSKIGKYSTRQLLIPPSKFIRKGDIKKVKPLIIKKTQPKKGWVLVKGGYSQFRKISGLQNNFVDLQLTGDLKRSLRLQPRRKAVDVVIRGKFNIKKVDDNEDRFNKKIFGLSKSERFEIEKRARKRVREFIIKSLNES